MKNEMARLHKKECPDSCWNESTELMEMGNITQKSLERIARIGSEKEKR